MQINVPIINETNTSHRNVPLFCCRNINPFLNKVLIFDATSHWTKLTTYLLAANRKANRNKARIS